MSVSEVPSAVRDDKPHHRFVLEQDGHLAQLVYEIKGSALYLLHTEVPDALGGHGIGGQLVRAAVERARDEGLTTIPWCPFARRWLREHPEVADTITIDWKTPPPSS